MDAAWRRVDVSTNQEHSSPGNAPRERDVGRDADTQPDGTAIEGALVVNFLALQDNGGATETHALFEGSVAIDVIPAEDCLDAYGEPLTTDQRGFPRDSMCDVGAFEVQP